MIVTNAKEKLEVYKKTYKKSATTKSILIVVRVSSSFRMYTLLSDELILFLLNTSQYWRTGEGKSYLAIHSHSV